MSRSRRKSPVSSNCVVNHSHQADAKRTYRRRWRRSVKQTIRTLWAGTRHHLLPNRAAKYNVWMLPADGKHWMDPGDPPERLVQDPDWDGVWPPEGWDRK